MTTKSQAVRELSKLGFHFDESVTCRIGGTWIATIDVIGRRTIEGDCRGIALCDQTATASEFWGECVQRAREMSEYLGDCPHPAGECDFHDCVTE